MSNALYHPTARARTHRTGRSVPVGFGLLIGAGISVGLWVGIFELGAWLLG